MMMLRIYIRCHAQIDFMSNRNGKLSFEFNEAICEIHYCETNLQSFLSRKGFFVRNLRSGNIEILH